MIQTIQLSVSGMSCAGCVASVEKALHNIHGVQRADVNFAEHTALVTGSIAAEQLIKTLVQAGYGAAELQDNAEHENSEAQAQRQHYRRLLSQAFVAAIVGFPLMATAMFGLLPGIASNSIFWMIIGLLTSFVMWFSGRHFFIGAWTAFKRHDATMDTLIALGTGTAWLYSMTVVMFPDYVPVIAQHAYFEAAIIIISLINFGSALEMAARNKTSQAIQKLIGLQAKTATVIRDGKEQQVSIHEIGLGETLKIRPGEKIAVDGNIIDGESDIDESMLTGEPIALLKQINDEVIAGTINGSGSFLYVSKRIGKDTVLAQIIAMVRRAQSSKPKISKLVDKIAALFVPTVMIISVITFLLWYHFGAEPRVAYALVSAMTVLVIACPCALGLATPISVIVGVGKAAEYGILIRNGDALQQASRLTAIVLDKTGTITEGKPDVVALHVVTGQTKDILLQLAATVDQHSEHSLAKAIVKNATQNSIEFLSNKNFSAVTGKGASAIINGDTVTVGNQTFMDELNINTKEFSLTVKKMTKQGQTVVYVAEGNLLQGVIGIADPIKADSAAAIKRLSDAGLLVVMISGDNISTAHAVATQVGITQVIAQVLPQDKAAQIEQLQASGLLVGMVGDGINDAPALAQADVGFAIGSGTDIAIESADITLIRGSLNGVVDAMAISKATLRNIKQNLFAAFIYNTIGIPLAAGVFFPLLGILLPPIYAGAAMALSSFTVVSNANRLRWFKP